MSILSPSKSPKELQDYDFTLINTSLNVTLDVSLGDKIDFSDPVRIFVHLVEKKSQLNSEETLPAETITIYVDKIVAIQHRVRMVNQLTSEQEHEWKKVFQEGPSRKAH